MNNEKVLILGSTGMLGRVVFESAKLKYREAYGLAKVGADVNLDVMDITQFEKALLALRPTLIINCIALVNLEECENNPAKAYVVNAKIVSHIVNYCRKFNVSFVQVSTDHYYQGDGGVLHDENKPVYLLNEYARTKFAGESYANTYEKSLVLRTNIVGCRERNKPFSFSDWVLDALINKKPIKLFSDVYHSPIHIIQFSDLLFEMIERNAAGVFNIASRNCVSKKIFIETIAENMQINFDWGEIESVSSLKILRANSLGLDVSKAEKFLNKKLPDSSAAVDILVNEYKKNNHVRFI